MWLRAIFVFDSLDRYLPPETTSDINEYYSAILEAIKEGNFKNGAVRLLQLHEILYETNFHKDHRQLIRKLRNLILDLSQNHYSNRTIKEARYIHQAEYGYSSHLPMGTVESLTCVTICVQDPATKRTCLIHMDVETDKAQVRQAILGLNAKGCMHARICGALYANTNSALCAESEQVLQKALDIINDLDIELLSADFGERKAPSNIVIYPEPFELAEATPDLPPERAIFHLASVVTDGYSSGKKELALALDLDASPARNPFLLKSLFIDIMKRVSKNDLNLADFLYYTGPRSGINPITPAFASYIESHVLAAELWERELVGIRGCLENKIKTSGIITEPAIIERAMGFVREKRIFIGTGATEANKPIYDFIKNEMFKEGLHGTSTNMRFPEVARQTQRG